MASLKDIVIMYQSLKREWDKKPPNLDRCGELLTKLKVLKFIRKHFTQIYLQNIVKMLHFFFCLVIVIRFRDFDKYR